jgi:hypothetical protein
MTVVFFVELRIPQDTFFPFKKALLMLTMPLVMKLIPNNDAALLHSSTQMQKEIKLRLSVLLQGSADVVDSSCCKDQHRF